jgi:3-deoxy-manno-octulosonate cytidylyltransferase (CMP-KDO synthetase)
MQHMNPLVVIPARYESSRLPGKPLVELCGVPMIIRTWRQCVKVVPPSQVLIATDDLRIARICSESGVQYMMTSESCLTGTDRVAEVAEKITASSYINVQGDEPAFNPDDLEAIIKAANAYPNDVINGYCPIEDEHEFRSPTIPKVIVRPDNRLLYMSRAAIPTGKTLQFYGALRQVCAYAFPPQALREFSLARQKTPMEGIEDIEILRFLELGYEVRMLPLSSQSISVDLPEDIPRVETRIRELGLE